MQKTERIKLNKPDRDNRVLVGDINDNSDIIDEKIAELQVEMNTKAPNESPNLTGTPTAPNPDGHGRSQIATVDAIKNALQVYEVCVVASLEDVTDYKKDVLYVVTSEDNKEYIYCDYINDKNEQITDFVEVVQGE